MLFDVDVSKDFIYDLSVSLLSPVISGRHSKDNCVHHLIIEYLKRKVSSTAAALVARYERAHNYKASSFDFCVRENDDGRQYKCDFVQRHGTDLVKVTMRKTIRFAVDGDDDHDHRTSPSIYTKYSVNVAMLSSSVHLTMCHLTVVQTANEVRIKLMNHQGQTIPLARFDLSTIATTTTSTPVQLVQHQFDTPNLVLWHSVDPFVDQSLLVQLNANLQIQLIRLGDDRGDVGDDDHGDVGGDDHENIGGGDVLGRRPSMSEKLCLDCGDSNRPPLANQSLALHIGLVLEVLGETITSSLVSFETFPSVSCVCVCSTS